MTVDGLARVGGGWQLDRVIIVLATCVRQILREFSNISVLD